MTDLVAIILLLLGFVALGIPKFFWDKYGVKIQNLMMGGRQYWLLGKRYVGKSNTLEEIEYEELRLEIIVNKLQHILQEVKNVPRDDRKKVQNYLYEIQKELETVRNTRLLLLADKLATRSRMKSANLKHLQEVAKMENKIDETD